MVNEKKWERGGASLHLYTWRNGKENLIEGIVDHKKCAWHGLACERTHLRENSGSNPARMLCMAWKEELFLKKLPI